MGFGRERKRRRSRRRSEIGWMDDALTAHATGRTGRIRDSHPLRQFSLRYRPLPHALPREFDSLELRLETFFFFFSFFFFIETASTFNFRFLLLG